MMFATSKSNRVSKKFLINIQVIFHVNNVHMAKTFIILILHVIAWKKKSHIAALRMLVQLVCNYS